jgi:hypothetical protein
LPPNLVVQQVFVMRYEISLFIDAGLVGHKLQYGFSATASNFEPLGAFYDNVLVVTVQAP